MMSVFPAPVSSQPPSSRLDHQLAEGLREILTVLNSNLPLDEILAYIVRKASALLRADAVAIYRLDEESGLLTIQSAQGLEPDYVVLADIPLGQSATGIATLERKPVAIPDVRIMLAQADASLDPPHRSLVQGLAALFLGILAVPLVIKDETYGAITLYYRGVHVFDQDEIALAVAFADQAALALENARLRAQVEQAAVAAERSRLARDLHDSVTQTLFSASLIAEVLPTVFQRSQEEGQQGLDELRQLTRGALAEMRTLLLELRPAALLEARLEELLRQLAEAVTGRSRIPIDLTVEGDVQLPPPVRLAFYRIAQEALNNMTKHACATQAHLILKVQPGPQASLSIRDDGCGFNLEQATPEHLGLAIMQERAESVGGACRVVSQPGEGTCVCVVWPSSPDEGGL